MEIEDMISIHFMEIGDRGESFTRVYQLLQEEGSLAPEVDGGIKLNGALKYYQTSENMTTLEPTDALLQECPTNAPLPTRKNMMPTTCVTRREITNRQYNAYTADKSRTAYELTPYTDGPGGAVLAEDSPERAADQAFLDSMFNSMFSQYLPGRE
eukprot:2112459-Rhodomonas_salina.2